jgi:hypothetical protein
MSAVQVFCPSCKIGSPRELHELTGSFVICTACGHRLSPETISTALKQYDKRKRRGSADPEPNLAGQGGSGGEVRTLKDRLVSVTVLSRRRLISLPEQAR